MISACSTLRRRVSTIPVEAFYSWRVNSGVPLSQVQSARVAVLLPCYNEEAAIAATVAGFRAALPGATVYVYDNNSTDRTREIAAKAGAIVRGERQQGKGPVVRRMFADVDADV